LLCPGYLELYHSGPALERLDLQLGRRCGQLFARLDSALVRDLLTGTLNTCPRSALLKLLHQTPAFRTGPATTRFNPNRLAYAINRSRIFFNQNGALGLSAQSIDRQEMGPDT
jgi:hypothetical protein